MLEFVVHRLEETGDVGWGNADGVAVEESVGVLDHHHVILVDEESAIQEVVVQQLDVSLLALGSVLVRSLANSDEIADSVVNVTIVL